jgi:catechol 2,3-dioxygenase-like lactoylglutathione lyase family enzyme
MKYRWVHLRMCLTCGRVVFYVKDLQRSLVFYRDLLGFKEVGQAFNRAAAARPCACIWARMYRED